MTSNTRLSILKPGRPREPLQDLSQLLPTNDEEETTTTDNHKRRVSFACVNKVKEFETGAECTTLHQTPAYDERFSMSSDSYQSSISELSHNKSTILSYGDTSKIANRSKGNDENVDIVEVGLCDISRGAPSLSKISGGESSMDITSVIMRDEHDYSDYESISESYYPLNLTKNRPSTQPAIQTADNDDKDVLESSSMETTEALPCLMTETIVTDFESLNQSMDISMEEVEAEIEKSSRLSTNLDNGPEKMFHVRQSTTLVSEKDVQFTVDAIGDIKDTQVHENIFLEKQVSLPNIDSSAMEEEMSFLKDQTSVFHKEKFSPLIEASDIVQESIFIQKPVLPLRNVEISTIPEETSLFNIQTPILEKRNSLYCPENTDILQENISVKKSAVFSSQVENSAMEETSLLKVQTPILEKENSLYFNENRGILHENISFKKSAVSSSRVESSAMEECTSLFKVQTPVVDKENAFPSIDNTNIEDKNDSQLEKTEVIEKDMEISFSKSFAANKESCFITFEELIKDGAQSVNNVEDDQNEELISTKNVLEDENVEPAEGSIKSEEQNICTVKIVPEKNSPPENNLSVEKEKYFHPSPKKIIENEYHSHVENIVADEKQLSHYAESDIEENKTSQSIQNSDVQDKEQSFTVEVEQVQLIQSIVAQKEQLKPTEKLPFVQKSVLNEKENRELVVGDTNKENNLNHEKFLSSELQNCQIIEGIQLEEEEENNLHHDESKIKAKNIESVARVGEENLQPQETVIDESLLNVEICPVEMESFRPTEIPKENNDVAFQQAIENTDGVVSNRPLKRKSDLFLPEIPPPEPSPKRSYTEDRSEIIERNQMIRKQIEKAVHSEIPFWTIVSMKDSEWEFGALWNRLHLIVTLRDDGKQCISKLRFIKKNSGVGDEILKVAIAPIIRKYRKKMEELCGSIEDVVFFMKMTIPSIKFAKSFAEDFSEIIEFEDISLNNGFASFIVANFKSHLLAKIQVDMRNIEDFSDSSIEIVQNVGNLDATLVRKIFFEARGGFDFFSKFVKNLNRKLNSQT